MARGRPSVPLLSNILRWIIHIASMWDALRGPVSWDNTSYVHICLSHYRGKHWASEMVWRHPFSHPIKDFATVFCTFADAVPHRRFPEISNWILNHIFCVRKGEKNKKLWAAATLVKHFFRADLKVQTTCSWGLNNNWGLEPSSVSTRY